MISLLLVPLLATLGMGGGPALGSALQSAASGPTRAQALPHFESILARPVVIGASMSAGWGIADGIALEDVLAQTLRRKSEIPAQATALFFATPGDTGADETDFAIDEQATIVFAVDYLFWFGYGILKADGSPLTSEDERLELLEAGLDNLDQLDCPLVVGDFPDMSDAIGKMLAAEQVPKPKTLAKLSARVHVWAKERGHTLVIPLARLVLDLKSDKSFAVAGYRIPKSSRARLLQWDQLHPTKTGLCLLAEVTTKALVDSELVPQDAVELNLLATLRAFGLETMGIRPAAPKQRTPK